MIKSFKLNGLACANCAAKIEKAVQELPEVSSATLDFMASRLTIEADNIEKAVENATKIVKKIEPEVRVTEVKEYRHEDECHSHNHYGNEKKLTIRVAIGAALFVLGIVVPWEPAKLPIFLTAYAVTGWDVVYRALKNVLRLSVLDESFLMSIATLGAFATGHYTEGVAVMLLYQIGELFQDRAVDKSRKSIAELMDIRPDYANVIRGGNEERVSPETVQIGEEILIKPGEKVALDGTVIQGTSTLDLSALTGESLPVDVEQGSKVLSGSINLSGVLRVRVSKTFGESTVGKILHLTEKAANKKAVSEKFITSFARYYTPAVVIMALLLALIPPLMFQGETFGEWIYRALTFLVISCPCALVISVPLSFFCGIGKASSEGVLVKGSNFLEALSKTQTVVFDKTGTLTKGQFEVQEIKSKTMEPWELLRLAAIAESYSSHPISLSVKAAYKKEPETHLLKDYKEIAGFGVEAVIEGKTVLVGNERLMRENKISLPDSKPAATEVHVAVEREYAGTIVISDRVKEDAGEAVRRLKKMGVNVVMLTGDSESSAKSVAEELGITRFFAGLLPGDKVSRVEELFTKKGKLVFVGDGINDAPVLARADVGVAMGGLGSDAAIEAADVVLMTDEPLKLVRAIEISKKIMGVVWQNIIFSLGVKFAVLLLGALGIASMWAAVFADVGVTVLAVLNAVRMLRKKASS